MSFPSHGHRILSVVVKIHLICSGIEQGTNIPIIINLPLVFILLVIFIVFSEIYILCDISLWWWWDTYHVQVQTVWFFRQTTSKIANWVLLWQFLIPYFHLRLITPPFQRFLLNTNRINSTGFYECLCHWPLQNITHRCSEYLNWWAWWIFWALFISFRRSNDLFNHSYFYFIVVGVQVTVTRCIGWVYG